MPFPAKAVIGPFLAMHPSGEPAGQVVGQVLRDGPSVQGLDRLGVRAHRCAGTADGVASPDGEVSLWDATTLELLGTVHPPHLGEPVPSGVQFIGDSHDVAIASHDGRTYRWQTDIGRAIRFACQRLTGTSQTTSGRPSWRPSPSNPSVQPHETSGQSFGYGEGRIGVGTRKSWW